MLGSQRIINGVFTRGSRAGLSQAWPGFHFSYHYCMIVINVVIIAVVPIFGGTRYPL